MIEKPLADVWVRYYGGTYIAKITGFKSTVSCTAGKEQAAQRAADKFFGSDYEVRRIHPENDHVYGIFMKTCGSEQVEADQ